MNEATLARIPEKSRGLGFGVSGLGPCLDLSGGIKLRIGRFAFPHLSLYNPNFQFVFNYLLHVVIEPLTLTPKPTQ